MFPRQASRGGLSASNYLYHSAISFWELRTVSASPGEIICFALSRVNQISAASGVAYTETRGATTLSNWTDVGPKAWLRSLGQRRRARRATSRRWNVQAVVNLRPFG